MENWDDLRLFLATARAGSSRASADELGVNQSTVSRRIAQLEKQSGVRLFDRQPSGLELTEAGEELFALAVEVEAGFATLDRRLQGRDLELRGPVRLTLPDFLVTDVAAHLVPFAKTYPHIEVELLVDNGFVNLTRRQADVALRLAIDPPEHLIGRRIAPVMAGVYGAPDYLEGRGDPPDYGAMDWIRWEEQWRGVPAERWVDAHAGDAPVRGRINTSHAHAELVARGLGVGVKACHTGDADPRLRRVGEVLDFGIWLWILTHEDLKSTARVRALLRHLGDALSADRARFLGGAPDPAQ